jgi:hypothetical protein
MDHPRPWLKYVAVKDLADQGNLGNMDVLGSDGEKLGTLDGFIIDEASARPYHVVVSAGGWFTHKYFLVPVGHVVMSDSTLTSDLTKDRVKRFPGFDKGEFEKLSADDLKRMNAELATACCADGVTIVATAWETGDHYRAPDWWQESYYRSAVGDRH